MAYGVRTALSVVLLQLHRQARMPRTAGVSAIAGTAPAPTMNGPAAAYASEVQLGAGSGSKRKSSDGALQKTEEHNKKPKVNPAAKAKGKGKRGDKPLSQTKAAILMRARRQAAKDKETKEAAATATVVNKGAPLVVQTTTSQSKPVLAKIEAVTISSDSHSDNDDETVPTDAKAKAAATVLADLRSSVSDEDREEGEKDKETDLRIRAALESKLMEFAKHAHGILKDHVSEVLIEDVADALKTHEPLLDRMTNFCKTSVKLQNAADEHEKLKSDSNKLDKEWKESVCAAAMSKIQQMLADKKSKLAELRNANVQMEKKNAKLREKLQAKKLHAGYILDRLTNWHEAVSAPPAAVAAVPSAASAALALASRETLVV